MILLSPMEWPKRKWHRSFNALATGHAHVPSQGLLTGDSLASFFSSQSLPEFQRKLQSANGSFAVVTTLGDMTLAAVDRIRSIPLFYSISSNGALIISEVAENLRKAADLTEWNITGREEFFRLGYVMGKSTLLNGMFQLLAGEYLVYDSSNQDSTVKRYFDYMPGQIADHSSRDANGCLDDAYEKVFERLIQFLNGRLAIIPLSGGNDSRLIAYMLNKLGYDNVLCFTYNLGGSKWETNISREVARRLGFDWCEPEYSARKWHKWYQSSDLIHYQRMAANWSSLAHVSDWPAVQSLMEGGIKNGVVIPGHACDFLAGSHVPRGWIYRHLPLPAAEFLRTFWSRYDQAGTKGAFPLPIPNLAISSEGNVLNPITQWQQIVWRERQSKFIANAVRVYDYFGLDWALPFWDSETINVWESFPFTQLDSAQLHAKYVRSLMSDATSPNPPQSYVTKRSHEISHLGMKSCRFSLQELAEISKKARYNPRTLRRMILKNGATAISLLERLEVDDA